MLRVTVCQWPDTPGAVAQAWEGLVAHAKAEATQLVLLPDTPFFPWLPRSRKFSGDRWAAAVEAHETWEERFAELGAIPVLGTRPIDFGYERLNEGFAWEPECGSRAVHVQALLLNESRAWEATWYHPAPFDPMPGHIGNADEEVRFGFLIGTELLSTELARGYEVGRVPLLVTPRASGIATRSEWLEAGRAAAVLGGAFSVSSNRADDPAATEGPGWIVSPSGDVLALTTHESPFVTLSLDLH